MKNVYNTFRPDGFSTVNSYLFAEHPQELIDFLQQAFYAIEVNRTINPDNGEIRNCILKIGDSCFMLSQARGEFLNMRTSFYLYTEEVDQLYRQALAKGAQSVFEPADMDYGDRQAGVIDPSGNYWWISKRLEQKNYDE